MKIPESVYVILHTKSCGRKVHQTAFEKPDEAAWSRENTCHDARGRLYSCRLIRYDRQKEEKP